MLSIFRPRAYYGDMVPAMLASGQDARDMARHSDQIQVSGCMKYVTVEVREQTILIGFGVEISHINDTLADISHYSNPVK